MQCYEGLDEAKALYEWKYGKQLLYTQILKDKIGDVLGDATTMRTALDRLHASATFSSPSSSSSPGHCCARCSSQAARCC